MTMIAFIHIMLVSFVMYYYLPNWVENLHWHENLLSLCFSIYRYKLTFTAQDDTSEATFFCHDDTARLVVCRACNYLINPLHPQYTIPKQLADFISKTFTFVVDLINPLHPQDTIPKQLAEPTGCDRCRRHHPHFKCSCSITERAP
jgi:hypothetical protein